MKARKARKAGPRSNLAYTCVSVGNIRNRGREREEEHELERALGEDEGEEEHESEKMVTLETNRAWTDAPRELREKANMIFVYYEQIIKR
jgi:hypothetical protein